MVVSLYLQIKLGSSTFNFKIKLHIKDLDVYNFIKDNLNIRKVIYSISKREVTFEVTIQSEIVVILAIFFLLDTL